MSILRKNAIIETIIWGVATLIIFLLFFSVTPEEFLKDKTLKLISVIPIGFAYLVHFYILYSIKKLTKLKVIVSDERDEKTKAIANNGSFIITLLFVYIFAIYLYEHYLDSGSVPVVFMWFLGYVTITVASFSSAISTLIVDIKNS